MIPKKTVNDLINKHALLEKELSSGEIDKNSFAEKSKEYADLNEIITIAKSTAEISEFNFKNIFS